MKRKVFLYHNVLNIAWTNFVAATQSISRIHIQEISCFLFCFISYVLLQMHG